MVSFLKGFLSWKCGQKSQLFICNTCLVGPLTYSLKVKGLNLKFRTKSYLICFWWFDNQNKGWIFLLVIWFWILKMGKTNKTLFCSIDFCDKQIFHIFFKKINIVLFFPNKVVVIDFINIVWQQEHWQHNYFVWSWKDYIQTLKMGLKKIVLKF